MGIWASVQTLGLVNIAVTTRLFTSCNTATCKIILYFECYYIFLFLYIVNIAYILFSWMALFLNFKAGRSVSVFYCSVQVYMELWVVWWLCSDFSKLNYNMSRVNPLVLNQLIKQKKNTPSYCYPVTSWQELNY